ncbi:MULTISPECIES: LysR family transcriptional regulator [unclassified Ruegeria]|uniref:LysR family transcriptional regulator n=1 Tax=unclassified Ruegeria TaxID=2625375 RepID=UPI001489931E|nr:MULTISPECIES: LysR family transcriptional regulator [unclassified Ruegeria]NOD33426.1 LysR family transcriptional regulator [Ruegeria sp. HKCCD7296]NOD48513.1 LysR family transcriptional regulator [Ruegeria sp. HKCCD5849]NOD52184.1 LysR family transcriptional regulator [Ruegeria sp. HKCCD5851]NOD66843.1 LysR family transcriptional regulator [Ruegeria sp. HKCCD7303]NOE33675.1 LysR family transcriptional regulator [Ruegeria sp. HKCCD7318]
MQNKLPPLGWLRTFEAAARHLSFTGAARDLNMTQSAVSQQIKSLEGHLGQPLFLRRPKALELTEAGITYLPVVREAFRTLMRGTQAVTGAQPNAVQVQCNISFAVNWLAPRLPMFQAEHPDVQLNIFTELWEPREMAEGAAVEIRFSLRPSDTTRTEMLRTEHYYPVCAPGYQVSLDDLQEKPLFDCSNLLSNWSSWAEEQGLTWGNPSITYATTYLVCLSAVTAGGGLCLAHDAIAQHLIERGQLVAPFEHRAPMPEAYYLLLSPQAEDTPGAVAFANWIRREIGSTT